MKMRFMSLSAAALLGATAFAYEANPVARIRPRLASDVTSSNWTIGCEVLDRELAVFAEYKDYAGGHLYVYDPKTGDDDTYLGDAKAKVKDLGIPVPGNSIYAMVAVEKDAPKGKVLISATSEKVTKVYGISYPDAEFFEYDGKGFKRHGKWMEKLSYPGPERSRRV